MGEAIDESDLGAIMTSDIRRSAREVLQLACERNMTVATAESCTGGLMATLLTDLPGVSHRFECGFVVYSNEAKTILLGIPASDIERYGAVSREVAIAMACQALQRSNADVAASITGFAGPDEQEGEEGLVHLAVAMKGEPVQHREEHFGAIGRDQVRNRSLQTALDMLRAAVKP